MPVVLIEKQTPQITVVTLNRPERRNALTIELLTELQAAIKIASEQPEQRVLILQGAGAAFCTGLDLKEAADHTKAHATAEMVANSLVAISQTRLVTIAAVHGAPGALAQTKGLIEELWSSSVKEDVDLALKYHLEARESDEAREGIAAFNEKRKPRWVL